MSDAKRGSAVIVDANSVDDIVKVLKDKATYPSPVRAVGSNHSTSPCGTAEGGTLLRMKMKGAVNFGSRGNQLDLEDLKLTVEDLDRYGPSLVLDQKSDDGDRVLVWSQ